MNLDSFYDFRRRLVERLAIDLVGPESEEEILQDPPITRYTTGIIYPSTAGFVPPEQDIDEPDDYDEIATPDPPVSLASTRYPSSMGMTFAVEDNVREILVTVEAARYEPVDLDDQRQWEGDEFLAEAAPSRARVIRRGGWKRVTLGPKTITLQIDTPVVGESTTIFEGLDLYHRIRPASDGAIPITLALVNRLKAPFGERDQHSFFQPSIIVRSVEEGAAIFVERKHQNHWSDDEDLQINRLLYRHAKAFAVGHGCSVQWEPPVGSDRAEVVATTYHPQFDLSLMDSNPEINSPAFDMATLAKATTASAVVADLRRFVAEYRAWIGSQQEAIHHLPLDLRETAEQNLRGCREAADRMEAGIDLLEADSDVWNAFVLANAAMLEQRARTEWLRRDKPESGPSYSGHTWRPFQLAFILQCLRGVAIPDSEDREITDLLWFPTGGGKTEAYLGLIAFAIFHRRLTHQGNGAGVTALMRYTLRLLTTQQFERAASLIVACEYLRRTRNSDYGGRLGDKEIGIGLWVGQAASPNSRSQAENVLDRLRNGATVSEGNPIQLQVCPWCGTRFRPSNYYLNRERSRLIIDCKNGRCEFFRGLPVFVVDEDLYDHRPSLIISTVDKFASLPWRERVADLFNLGHEEPPPQLIIQDELHLISGPLGTMTGLYETAVELLCTEDGQRPKIIASTATIRRATTQSRALFGRERLAQFPPPGLDARDSFFAVQASPAEKGSRLYVGLMAPGVSHTTLMVRTYASLLQAVAEFEATDAVRDPYWTLVGFFNSLRVLGGARMQVSDDVTDRIELLAAMRGVEPRRHDKRIELTSRESSGEIPERLKEMSIAYPDNGAIDVLLATNMISVGVDIDRLGLMVVMGQPPSTSEYIQATSRVGRKYPGLVVTLFNAARSRDRSHYESFMSYHSALYRQVEATSVTPFSPRARDRGLHAVIVALARMLLPEFRPQTGARAILSSRHQLGVVRQIIETRVRVTDPEAARDTLAEFDELLDEWERMARDNPGLVYQDIGSPDRALLIDASSQKSVDVEAWQTLWSLRDVDQTSHLYLVR